MKIEDTNLLSSVLVPVSDDLPEHCRVLGYVRPAISFELRLPTTEWNGRFYMAGCGALCGRLSTPATTDETQESLRLFMVPSWGHCGILPGPGGDRHSIDALSALERWVEDGVAPESILTTKRDEQGGVAWTRPVCPYPERARYDGVGDVTEASSFRCFESEDTAAH